MGTTFVSLSDVSSRDEIGFWMRDEVLELWLRLLALHLPEPVIEGTASYAIRNQWLNASGGYYNGCVPHNLPEIVSTPDGRRSLEDAIESLTETLAQLPQKLDGSIINLLGIAEPGFQQGFSVQRLMDVGNAFRALLVGKLNCTVKSTEFMPGSK